MYKFKLKFTLFKGFSSSKVLCRAPYIGVAQGDAGQSGLLTMLYAKFKKKIVFGHMCIVDAMTHLKQTT
jgi:hypothetical protein